MEGAASAVRTAGQAGCGQGVAAAYAALSGGQGAWVLLVRVPPSGDYATFWGYAKALAGQPVLEGGRYMALFPHIFGYSSFLSWFIRLLGPGALLAQGLNVLLTAASGSLLFLLGRRWWGLPAGISAYLLWIVCPSQTIYNSLVLSEPLYTALLLLPLYVLGLTCAQMLVEVAGRYHYSLIPVLLLLGQAAIFPPAPAETKNFQKNRESP